MIDRVGTEAGLTEQATDIQGGYRGGPDGGGDE
jgi:hypothetical protein